MDRTKKGKLLWQLFASMFYLSAFTFGGGYVIITLMKNKFVDKYHWLEETEMLDLTALAQSAPGAIAVNAAILVGWRLAGFLGMVTAVVATVLPPLLVLSVISLFYAAFAANPYVNLVLAGMQAGVAAVIFDVVASLARDIFKTGDWLYILLMVLAFAASFYINVVYIILFAAAVGIVQGLILGRKEGKL